MDLTTIHSLIDYHYWSRDRLLEAIAPLTPEQFTRDLGSSHPSVRDTVAHLYFAEWVWNERWQGRSPTGPPALTLDDVAAIAAAWSALEAGVRAFIGGLSQADADRVLEYRLLSGQPGSSTIAQLVQHLVNHSSYHRGQVTTMLRQLGAAPPKSTDMVTFFWR